MSVVTKILDRLSGVTAVREKLHSTAGRVEKLADMLLDHERRIITLEVSKGTDQPKALPPPRRSK
jgi:hypothetical protein